MQSVMDAAGFTEELVMLDETTLPARYTTMDLTALEDYRVYVSGSMGTPEEFSIFQVKSDKEVTPVYEAVQRRVEDLRLSFEDYRPEQMPKIENAVLLEKSNYVMLAICENADDVRAILEKL